MNNYKISVKDLEQVERIVQSEINVQTGFSQLLEYSQAKWQHDIWRQVAELNVEEDVEQLNIWLQQVLAKEPPPDNIKAYWFGLFNPVLENGEVTCGLYVSGSTQFDSSTSDWACRDEDSYLPEGRYANSQILRQIYSLVADTKVALAGEYVLCLGYACLAVKHIFNNSLKPVVVGFDAGDFIRIT